jgi:hypothetical protein
LLIHEKGQWPTEGNVKFHVNGMTESLQFYDSERVSRGIERWANKRVFTGLSKILYQTAETNKGLHKLSPANP